MQHERTFTVWQMVARKLTPIPVPPFCVAFISHQYRPAKAILALGASKALIDQAGVATILANGDPHPGIAMGAVPKADNAVARFLVR